MKIPGSPEALRILNVVEMNIGVDARLRDGGAGGIQQIVIGLAQGIGEIEPPDLNLYFIMERGHSDWLRPFLPRCGKVVEIGGGDQSPSKVKTFLLRYIRSTIGHTLARKYYRLPPEPPELIPYNLDLVHFVHQRPFKTEKPFIFMPQDLQHEHYPQYFSKRNLVVRRELYKNTAAQSATVVCISEFTKRDVIQFLGVPEEKTKTIYCAPPTTGYGSVSDEGIRLVQEKYHLPENFVLYPAKTFPHKNHKRLLSAIARINANSEQGVNLVCTGSLTSYFHSDIEPMIDELKIRDRITFTGFIDPNELNHVYAASRAVVFPSEFEGFGMPVVEAFSFGKAVACSNSSCLPEICGEAAIYFSPDNVEAMAGAIQSLMENHSLYEHFTNKSKQRASKFTWKQSANQYLELYQQILSKQ